MVANQRTGIEVGTSYTEIINDLKDQGAKIGFVFGRFETMHPGNLHMLRIAAEHCDVLIVGIWRDTALVKAYGREPLFPEMERSILVGFYKMVTAVIPYAPDELQILLETVEPDIVFVQEGDPFFLPAEATYKVRTVPRYEDYSLEYIIHKLRKDAFYFDHDLQMWCHDLQEIGLPTVSAKTLRALLAHLKKHLNMEF